MCNGNKCQSRRYNYPYENPNHHIHIVNKCISNVSLKIESSNYSFHLNLVLNLSEKRVIIWEEFENDCWK